MLSSTLSNTLEINLLIYRLNVIIIDNTTSKSIGDRPLKFLCYAILKIKLPYIRIVLRNISLKNLIEIT